ncbi:small integral membrane protein 35 isoform X3 [Prinia subflava]|uniref:small integral membrane protein 35 isoform X3 n=1 Tax=Prinia subflava TaxID=208062 RepID=UPI002FE1FCFC
MDPQTGQEPIKVIGVVLGIGLALLVLASFGYTFIRWYRRGHSRHPGWGQWHWSWCHRSASAARWAPRAVATSPSTARGREFSHCPSAATAAQEVPGPALEQPPLAWDGERGGSLIPGLPNTDPGESSHVPHGSETSQPPAHPETWHSLFQLRRSPRNG